MRRTHRALAALALGVALVGATTAAATAMPPTGTRDQTDQRKALYQSELERTLARHRALGAIAAQPAARTDPSTPDPGVDVPATLLIGLAGGLVGGAAAMLGWTATTRRRRPRPAAGTASHLTVLPSPSTLIAPGRSTMWDTGSRRLRSRYRPLVLAVMLVAAAVAMAPAAAADTPTITREINHPFSTVQHFDPIPECGFPGATEYATGNDHLVIVEEGDSLHVTFGETFRILEVPDDPAFPTIERQGTDALHFNLTKSGTDVFTESFHDFSQPDFKIDYYRTFVYANGDVRVDREIIRNPPPSC